VVLPHQQYPYLISDGALGAIITWTDERSTTRDIYAQRIDPAGNRLWNNSGVAVCTAAFDQSSPRVVSDNMGGAVIAWSDRRGGFYSDIFAQRLDASGQALWTADGRPVCTAFFSQYSFRMVSDGAGGAMLAWEDTRNDLSTSDVYAQRIERNGQWGYPAPHITGIRDVPGDQGGSVNVAWYASRLDVWPEELISYYTIWRAIDEETAAMLLRSGTPLIEGVSGIGQPIETPVVRRGLLGGEPYFWQNIMTVYADITDHYSEIVPTLFDSTAVSAEYHYFQLIAHGNGPDAYWISSPDSGYSVDNLAPCPPLCLAGAQEHLPEGLRLTWDPNIEVDLDNYTIYRGTDENFVPGPGNLLASPCDTCYFDGGWTWDSGYCYKVAAVDVHGKESDYALLCSDNITGDETPATPLATYLEQNYPNPFNPSTRIAFGLKAPSHVRLRIYDAAGRLVRVLVEERRDAGTYNEIWNGLDDSGRAAASGVYFYGLTAGNFRETKKMVLLR